MFKVSFKESPKNPSKLVTKVGNETTFILKGTCKLPAFWKHLPDDIVKWIESQKHVEIYEDMANNVLIIFSKGVSKCHPEDKFDTILGERMAESRAKECIYKFFYNLCCKLYDYYNEILFGYGVISEGSSGSLVEDIDKYDSLYRREEHHRVELLQSKINE